MSGFVAIETTVTGLGYDLVDVERAPRGLLRVSIDRLPGNVYDVPGEFVTVEDCEKVTRQLQRVLEVENFDYARLEVSSPGLDRPLKREADYRRFAGEQVAITLRLPLQGRRKFQGVLQATPAEGEQAAAGWRLVFDDGKGEQALDFELGDVREARLVPVVDFKGRRVAPPPAPSAAEPTVDRVDGGREE